MAGADANRIKAATCLLLAICANAAADPLEAGQIATEQQAAAEETVVRRQDSFVTEEAATAPQVRAKEVRYKNTSQSRHKAFGYAGIGIIGNNYLTRVNTESGRFTRLGEGDNSLHIFGGWQALPYMSVEASVIHARLSPVPFRRGTVVLSNPITIPGDIDGTYLHLPYISLRLRDTGIAAVFALPGGSGRPVQFLARVGLSCYQAIRHYQNENLSSTDCIELNFGIGLSIRIIDNFSLRFESSAHRTLKLAGLEDSFVPDSAKAIYFQMEAISLHARF